MEKEPIKDLPNTRSTADKVPDAKKGELSAQELGKVSGGQRSNTTCATDHGDGCDE